MRKAWLDVDPCRRSGTGHPGCVWVRDLGHTPPPIRVMSGFEILAARRYRTQMPLPNQVLRELEEFDAAAVPVDLLTIFQKLSIGLDERNVAEDERASVHLILAPLIFHTRADKEQSSWKLYFAPQLEWTGTDGKENQFPSLSMLNATSIDEWAGLADSLSNPVLKSRFADAVWELSKVLCPKRRDLHLYGRLAADSYIRASAEKRYQYTMISAEGMARALQLAVLLNMLNLISAAVKCLMNFADAAEPAHIGHWLVPFRVVIGMRGVSKDDERSVVQQLETRFHSAIRDGDHYRSQMAGEHLAKFFAGQKNHSKAKEIVLTYGRGVLKATEVMSAFESIQHMSRLLTVYREAGLREDAEKVRLALEKRAGGVSNEMQEHRVEIPINSAEANAWIAKLLNAKHPYIALFRLCNSMIANPEKIRSRMAEIAKEFIFHRLFDMSIIGYEGLPVAHVGSYDSDQEGRFVMDVASEMGITPVFLLRGFDALRSLCTSSASPA